MLGWLASSLVVAARLTQRHGEPAGPAPEVEFARSEDVALVARDGARVPGWSFDVDGARGTAVLLHPNGGSAASMLDTARLWAELGWASIAVTLRGHGEAEGARNDAGWSARLDVVAAVEWAAARRPGPVVVHGVSLGAAAACLAASAHAPEARARILGHVLEAPYVDLDSAVRARTRRELPWPLGAVAAAGLRVTAPLFIGDVARIAPLRHAPDLAGRVLLLAGLQDSRAPAADTRRFAEALGARARLVERELDHTGWLGAGPDGPLRDDLAAWLAEGAASPVSPPRVLLGSEVLARGGFAPLRGKRVGLITNPSAVDRELRATIDLLRGAEGVTLVALFGPEHGVYGDVPAGDPVATRTDARTGLPVHSLYGKTRRPTPEMLQGLDAVVYELQDTGARSFTFISTMGEAMDACGAAGVEFVVLDRPNPLGGLRVEGPLIEREELRSFVGRWDVPYVYGLTCGELAGMIVGERWIASPCALTVVPMEGWRREMVFADTGLPWVPASPHVPRGDSPLYQVATGMLGELGGVSNGVGYTLPFETIAAPGVDPHALAAELSRRGLAGLRFRPITYKPYYATFAGEVIGGVQVHVVDAARAPLTALNFHALEALRAAAGLDVFAAALAAGKDFAMFDKVNGTDATRKALQAGVPAREIVASWAAGEDAFRARRAPYLLYPATD